MEVFQLVAICSFTLSLATFLFLKGLRAKVSLRVWLFGFLAVLLIPFGLAWCATSFAEGEPFAGYMGIAVFSGLGAVAALLAYLQVRKERPERFPGRPASEDPSNGPVGLPIGVLVLALAGSAFLPPAVGAHQLLGLVHSREALSSQLEGRVLSDPAFPTFIRKAIAYETLYGEYPDAFETRMMQAMVSGVEEDQVISFLNVVAPESERFALLEKVVSAGAAWLKNDKPYPELAIDVAVYSHRLQEKSEFVMTWLYDNFTFPNMEAEAIARIESGEFSDRLASYMVAPPDSLRPTMIVNGAQALRRRVQEAQGPDTIVLADQWTGGISVNEGRRIKTSVSAARVFGAFAWILASALWMGAFALLFWKMPNPWRFAGLLALGTVAVGLIVSSPLRDIDSTVYHWVNELGNTAPSPVLAVLDRFLPDVLRATKGILDRILQLVAFAGVAFLLVPYRHTALAVLKKLRRTNDPERQTV